MSKILREKAFWLPFLVLFVLQQAHSDELDDALERGMRDYAASFPDYPDIPDGWLRALIDGLEANADLALPVTTLTIKSFVLSRAPNDHPNWPERRGTIANALDLHVSKLAYRSVTGRELVDRLDALHTKLYPPPKIPVLPPNYPEGYP